MLCGRRLNIKMEQNLIEINGKFIDEKSIYSRNIENSYEKLKNSRVCILGLGGLGSNIANSLARSGIGNLKIVDFDKVEVSNLNRQLYRLIHIGMKKTEALKSIIEEINPFINIICDSRKVDTENILEIVKGYDIIVEAFDSAESKAMVISEILSDDEKKYIVSGSGMAGIEDSNKIKTTKKFKHLFVCGDEYSDFDKYNTIMSPRVNICAGHQANMVLKILLEEM